MGTIIVGNSTIGQIAKSIEEFKVLSTVDPEIIGHYAGRTSAQGTEELAIMILTSGAAKGLGKGLNAGVNGGSKSLVSESLTGIDDGLMFERVKFNTGGNNKIIVTEEMIKKAMKDAPLKTQQNAVSLPAIQRYIDRLVKGDVSPPIKIDNGIIVDGNHRYISGRVFGKEPSTIDWYGGKNENVIKWDDMTIDPFDWGNK
jgi:hypothetical protein